MNRLLPVLLFLMLGPALGAEPGANDPLQSAACHAARAELEDALNGPEARRGLRLERARRAAADACLGRASATPQRSGAPAPPQAVPSPAPVAPPAVAQPRIIPAPPPLVIPRPTAITSCDAAGCWDSEGRRLNQIGPQLVGPGGLCSVQGGLVQCP